jgi:benzoyl-CoA-dihydrodiol lyase
LECRIDASSYRYEYVDVVLESEQRRVTVTVRAPDDEQPSDIAGILAAGDHWWPLKMARELDDAILMLRTNHLSLGTWVLKTRGNPRHVTAVDAVLGQLGAHWFVRETVGMLRRTLARLDVSSRTLIALVDPGSCFAGTLCELALAADRTYMADFENDPPAIEVSAMNLGALPRVDGQSRLSSRFYGEISALETIRRAVGQPLPPGRALGLGLITAALDDIDWTDEIRIALEERASLSPDALTGLEANLRFGGAETMETRVFGRLSAWQNWIFIRPNAVGSEGALKTFGTGTKAKFNWERV